MMDLCPWDVKVHRYACVMCKRSWGPPSKELVQGRDSSASCRLTLEGLCGWSPSAQGAPRSLWTLGCM